MKIGIVIDLETLAVHPGAAILSIGACPFVDAEKDGQIPFVMNRSTFYTKIYLGSQNRALDTDTLIWWLTDPSVTQAMRDEFIPGVNQTSFQAAMEDFTIYWRAIATQYKPDQPITAWGNGASFDIAILDNAYMQLGLTPPWGFREIRDMRTIKEDAEILGLLNLPQQEKGAKHNALQDAIWEAKQIAYWRQQMMGRYISINSTNATNSKGKADGNEE